MKRAPWRACGWPKPLWEWVATVRLEAQGMHTAHAPADKDNSHRGPGWQSRRYPGSEQGREWEGGGAGPHAGSLQTNGRRWEGSLWWWSQEFKVMFSFIWTQVDTQGDTYRHVHTAVSAHTRPCSASWGPGGQDTPRATSTPVPTPGFLTASPKNGTKVLGEVAEFRTEAGNVLAEPGVREAVTAQRSLRRWDT